MTPRPRTPLALLGGMGLLLVVLVVAVERPLPGGDRRGWGGAPVHPGEPFSILPTPQPAEPAGPEPRVVEHTTIWRILFPYETFTETLQAGLRSLAIGIAEDSLALAQTTLAQLMQLAGEPSLFRTLQTEVWQVTIVLAGILLPLALAVSIGAALREGALSVHGYLSARQALLQGLLAVGAALSSHFLLSQAIDLSGQLSTAILEGLARSIGGAIRPGQQLVGLLLTSVLLRRVQGLASVFLSFTAVLLCAGLVLGFALAFLAREVLLLLAFGLAPLLLVLGQLAPLRWLQGLWLKTTLLALFLGPANALLLGIAVLVAVHANQQGLLGGGRLLGFLIAAGILSVLLGMNMLLGKTVYGALLEVGQRAWAATRGVMNLAGIALGAAAGVPLSAGAALRSPDQPGAGRDLARAAGHGLRATGLPGTAGAAAGLGLGANPEVQQLQRRLTRSLAGTNGPVGPLHPSQAVADARRRMLGDLPPGQALAASGLPYPALRQRVESGARLAQRGLEAVEALPLSTTTALGDLGFPPGLPLQDAAEGYAHSVIARYALGARAPAAAALAAGPAPRRLAGQDLDTAVQTVLQLQPGADTLRQVTPALLGDLTRAVHQRRTRHRQSPDEILASAARAADLPGLRTWIEASVAGDPGMSPKGGPHASIRSTGH